MDEISAIDHLEALAYSLGIQVRHEYLESEETSFHSGGLCRVKGKHMIIVNAAAPSADKVQTLAKALRRFDLSGVYIKPALRDLLEEPSEWE